MDLNVMCSDEFDPQYIRLKRQNQKLKVAKEQCVHLARFTTVITICLFVVLAGICIVSTARISSLNSKISSLSAENRTLVAENKSISDSYNDLSLLTQDASEIAVSLDVENETLQTQVDELTTKLATYITREELYDKYEYALVRSDGSRTDVTYDQIKTLRELVHEKGMTDETVDLILSLAMVESNGTEDALSNSSTAAGYGQFLSTTGKFVYTKLMNNSTYSHEYATDGDTNLEMMVEYLDYLNEKYDGNMNLVINEYRGINSLDYKKEVDKYLANNNLSISSIKLKD